MMTSLQLAVITRYWHSTLPCTRNKRQTIDHFAFWFT